MHSLRKFLRGRSLTRGLFCCLDSSAFWVYQGASSFREMLPVVKTGRGEAENDDMYSSTNKQNARWEYDF